ncbi:cytochrome B5 [Geobacter sp. FeAm09]|uniref:CopD family protein n=1 Tax=Geobacter sp. FeAm09 TaxID=2597769 RepID=UPI0011EEAF14|nr:CopD family protein [Geobacter sp. FeAm09]QEM68905.1 cytochrome B5 [Geobacter sp. FeAm09]
MPFILTIAFIVFSNIPANALEEYAQQTGKECGFCHLSRAGGGELTAAGKRFELHHSLADVTPKTAEAAPERTSSGALSRVLRLVSGYIHLVVAIFWFGTILYVHLVLKPAYASQGLPRGEVRVGLASMAAMALTGGILTHYRITSSELLLHTRFGILLLIKISLFAIMVVSALVAVFVIGPRLRARREEAASPAPAGTSFTPEELAFFDGTQGRPAYFAHNGTVYDASASALWKGGTHAGRHPAGQDLTPFLGQAPHGEDRLLTLPRVGSIAQTPAAPARPFHVRAFFFMAYMNLAMVFSITLIVALWRWW